MTSSLLYDDWLTWSCVGSRVFWEFTSTVVLSRSGNTISALSSPTSRSCNVSSSLPLFHEPWEEGIGLRGFIFFSYAVYWFLLFLGVWVSFPTIVAFHLGFIGFPHFAMLLKVSLCSVIADALDLESTGAHCLVTIDSTCLQRCSLGFPHPWQ